jgi:hypothetical protein
MRRPRQKLRVSTFPFLAVLLCAMGSLILLLMIFDRRAKIAALQKVHESAVLAKAHRDTDDEADLARLAEAERLAAANKQEWEDRCNAVHAKLEREELVLEGEIAKAREQLNESGAKVEAERDRAKAIAKQLEDAGLVVKKSQAATQDKEKAVVEAEQRSDAARRELARQAAELQKLEQALADVRTLRERQKSTYSLVPYLGKRGDNRRPLYLECRSDGYVFHPDEVSFSAFDLSGGGLRQEVSRRVTRLVGPERSAIARPYLLMLVRPDGIHNYYRAQQELAGAPIDFGYEFVEADWVLDFRAENDDRSAQPWMKVASLPNLQAGPTFGQRSAGLGAPQFPGTGFGGAGTPGGSASFGGAANGIPGVAGSNGSGFGNGAGGTQGGGAGTSGAGLPGVAGGSVGGFGSAADGTPGGGGIGNGVGGTHGGGAGVQGSGIPGVAGGGSGIGNGVGGTQGGGAGIPGNGIPGVAGGGSGFGNGSGGTQGGGAGVPGSGIPGLASGGSGFGNGVGGTQGGGAGVPGSGIPGLASGGSGLGNGVGGTQGGGAGVPGGGIPGVAGGGSGFGNGVGGTQGGGAGVPGSGIPSVVGGGSGFGNGGGAGVPGSGIPALASGDGLGNGVGGPQGSGSNAPSNGVPMVGGGSGVAAGRQAPAPQPDGMPFVANGGDNSSQHTASWKPASQGAAIVPTPSFGQGAPSGETGIPDAGGAATGPIPGGGGGTSAPRGTAGGDPAMAGGESVASAGGGLPSISSGNVSMGLGNASAKSKGGDPDADRGSSDTGSGPSTGFSSSAFAASLARSSSGGSASGSASPPSIGRLLGNRDFFIDIECNKDDVLLKYGNQRFSIEALGKRGATAGEENILAQTVRLIIARRQATVRPGEPRYRPLVRFYVRPDGLRAYYLAYPALADLGVPMSRENLRGP